MKEKISLDYAIANWKEFEPILTTSLHWFAKWFFREGYSKKESKVFLIVFLSNIIILVLLFISI